MFIDFRDHPADQAIETDICIVGAGAAGIALAQALANSRLDVCLLETGGFDPEAAYYQLAQTERQDGAYATSGCRLRYFGGSTNHWGGNNMPLDELDFAERPWVEHSGWPITRAQLDPWYERANTVLNAGRYAYTKPELEDANWPFPDIDLQLLKDVYWRLTPDPASFSSLYRDALETAPNLRVYLHATATELHASPDGRRAEAATIKSTDGRVGRARARQFVVAAGAMESSRLLLASRDVNPQGLGNDTDQLGRYFMMHPHVDIGTVYNLSPALQSLFNRHTSNGIEIIAGVSASAASQEKHAILNGAIMLQGVPDSTTGYVALKKLSDAIGLQYRAWRFGTDVDMPEESSEWMKTVLTDLDSVIAGLWNRALDSSYQGDNAGGTANIYLQSEQAPNPDSRITLSEETDALGVPRMRVDTRVLPIDKRTLLVNGELLGRELGLHNAGRVQLAEWLLDETVDWQRQIWGGCHHMGTTRMSADPKQGVVNADCRLHSVDNTWVASSSVFPTGGHANPTLTIVALALRLAEKLKAQA